jgi:hypothetical protein
MNTPKTTRSPQRKERNAFQAGCHEFESRPPLPEKLITVRKIERGPVEWRPSLAKCARDVPGV